MASARGVAAFGKAVWNGEADSSEELVTDVGDQVPMPEYHVVDRGYTRFTRWMSYVAGIALGVITLIAFVDVVTWKFFNWTVPSATDLIKYLNLVLVFLAAAYVQMDRGSVAIELIQERFHRILRLATRILASVLGAGTCLFAAYRSSYQLVDLYKTHAMSDGEWHFRVWPFQAVLVFGFVCLGVAFLFAIGRDIADYRKRRARYATARDHTATPIST
jgi:TRAP-type C4-dicarboxylate transport system permease small subunit